MSEASNMMTVEEVYGRYSALIKHLAGQYVCSGFDEDDLKQEAHFGVLKALEDHNPEAGGTFASTLVLRIRDTLRKVTGMHEGRARVVKDPALRAEHFDAPLTDADGGCSDETKWDTLGAVEDVDRLVREEQAQRLQRILALLPANERNLLIMQSECSSQQEFADTLNLPRETVRNRHGKALKNARAIARRLDRPSLIVAAPATIPAPALARAA